MHARALVRGAPWALLIAVGLHGAGPAAIAADAEPHTRRALFGDLHVHTVHSFDAYGFGVRATPDDAYRYARGEAIEHPLGYPVQLRGGALDFYAVTDHAVYLGAMGALHDPDDPLHRHPLAQEIIAKSDPLNPVLEGASIPAAVMSGLRIRGLDAGRVMHTAWERIIDAAERHNEPGAFTTFIAYEYTSSPQRITLHRNVIFAGARVSRFPFSVVDSPNPENLWRWMDDLREAGVEALAIPHNSNLSSGLTFEGNDWAGRPIDADYAARRLRNEPLVEVTQVKGTSEAHPALSPDDEWAGFEVWAPPGPDRAPGSYARDALRAGLALEATSGVNPYRFGLIGSSDGHNASSPVDEDRYFGKLGRHDGLPGRRGSAPADPEDTEPVGPSFLSWSAAGLAGVWAEENTRPSIYSALRRREAFATSGPRIQVRFFAGYGYGDALGDGADAVEFAYAGGVPMGGELRIADAGPPEFYVWAVRDPNEAPLQRVQVVKGWMAGGETYERVFDAACSDGLAPDPETHRCPDNGAGVDLEDCGASGAPGATELRGVWRDPTFSPEQAAFYYVRVLQNPTCRWSTWDAIRAGVAPAEGVPATIQERAWSSPIWLKR
ncbi:MAG: DUF3604 domain-containing protein [Gammaproteobacteria bacterium]|nr:DUF3604 domain-containing protein [Gammaproteobacteria bacterium]